MALKKMLGTVRFWHFVDFYGNHSSWCKIMGDIGDGYKMEIESISNTVLGSETSNHSNYNNLKAQYSNVKKKLERYLDSCASINVVERHEARRTNELAATVYEIYDVE